MNSLGLKRHKSINSIGSKFSKITQSLGTKFTPNNHSMGFTPLNNFKDGIVNDSNGAQQTREVIKGIYATSKPNYNSMEKHRKHKRTNFN